MDAGRHLGMRCLLCFLVIELVMGGPKCAGRWAIHSCGGGNGKRSEIEQLLGADESPAENDPLPGFVSDLKALSDRTRDTENYPVPRDGGPSSLSSDQLWDESPYEKSRLREGEGEGEDEASDNSKNIDRALDSLLVRLLLKRRLMG